MEALDILKKDWQKLPGNSTAFSESEISKMIHKKSSSIVRKILIFSVIEIILWTVLNFVSSDFDSLEKIHGTKFEVIISVFEILNYVVIAIFIFTFYRNYKNISSDSSTKILMHQILKTKKTVNLYVIYNLLMLALSMCLGVYIAIALSPLLNIENEKLRIQLTTIGVCFILFTIVFVVFWYLYKIIYGKLVQQLELNYKELSKLEVEISTNE
jgi:hypothetical protein